MIYWLSMLPSIGAAILPERLPRVPLQGGQGGGAGEYSRPATIKGVLSRGLWLG